MATYRWKKYNLVSTLSGLTLHGQGNTEIYEGKFKSLVWNGGKFIGSDVWGSTESVIRGDKAYLIAGTDVFEYSANGSGNSGSYNISATIYRSTVYSRTTSKGSYVQDVTSTTRSAYPDKGVYTDNYWYDYVGIDNTAPTTPGTFTQPSGTLEIGDAKVFTVGASTDAENNISKYVWQAQINGSSWSASVISDTTTPSATYVIPTATSLKIRVKAVDTGGLESDWRESNVYTVQKPQYYWSKYYATMLYDEGAWVYMFTDNLPNNYWRPGYTSYSFDAKTGIFTDSGARNDLSGSSPQGQTCYLVDDTNPRRVSRFRKLLGIDYESHRKTSEAGATYERGTLVQSGIVAVDGTYPLNGRHTDGYWYVRGGRVNASIAPPGAFASPTPGKKFKPNEVASIVFAASTAPNLSLYEVDYRYNNTGTWTPLAYNNALTRSITTSTDKSLKTLEIRVRAKNTSNVYSDYVYSEPFEIEHNVAPTVSLTGPGDNATLYENDTFNISGMANDADPDQSVTVYFQINSEARKVLATNLSQTQISLSKQLSFKGGKIFDGETALTGVLAEGVAHTLKVWAEDSEKTSSAIVERTFYVVPNRAPLLSVDAVVPSGVVDADKFKISGTSSDQDANSTVTVTKRINAGNAVEIYSGPGGAWDFNLALSQLVVGQNTIIIKVIDNYGAKTSKTVTLNKKEVKTPILQSVARYKIEPPKGFAKGVLLFIQRDEELDIKVELSMTLSGEQEQYETLTPANTAPVQQGVVEDTFEYEGLEAKQNIILKITPSRTDLSFDHKIHLISGAVD